MSLKPSLNATDLHHLQELYASQEPLVKEKHFNELTIPLREHILNLIGKQSEGSSESDDNKSYVFDFPSRLQKAIEEVATNAFRSLTEIEKNNIASKMQDHTGRPFSEDGNWKESHPAGNIVFLLDPMHDSLDDPTSELEDILDKWTKESAPGEDRIEAQTRILSFLKNSKQTQLRLDYLHLESLPNIFNNKRLTSKLRTLSLRGNHLTSLPKQICFLQDLTALDLSYNDLTSFLEEVSLRQNLTTRDPYANSSPSTSEQMGGLHNLKCLNLSGNRLRSLSPQIGLLHNLNQLYLPNNELTSLPKEIGWLQELTNLSLHHNELTSLPKEISWLQKLTDLSLHHNELTSLPKEIGELTQLIRLDLSNNKLRSLPDEISQLQNLNLLDLRNNPELRSPAQINPKLRS